MAEQDEPHKPSVHEGSEPTFALDSLPPAPRSPHRRAVGLAATALLVVAALVGLFAHATSDPGGAFDTLLQIYTPTPQPTFVPGANLVYIMHGVPWGVLTIDGKQIPQSDAIAKGISLTHGTHHLVYQARYFPTLRCVISAPSQPEDSCPIDGPQGESGQFISDHGLARMVNLDLESSKLQANQFSALEQQMSRMLSAKTYSTTIAPGARYMTEQGAIVTASEPLTLRLQVSLDPIVSGDSTTPAGPLCIQLCSAPVSIDSVDSLDNHWWVNIEVSELWSLTDAHGHTTVMNHPVVNPGLTQDTLRVGIQLTASGWNISGLEHPDGAVLSDNASATVTQFFTSQTQPQGTNSSGGYSFAFGSNPLDGCVIDLNFNDDLATNVPITMRVLWRFGTLEALDGAAHKRFPSLPMANAAEQAAASLIRQQAQGAG